MSGSRPSPKLRRKPLTLRSGVIVIAAVVTLAVPGCGGGGESLSGGTTEAKISHPSIAGGPTSLYKRLGHVGLSVSVVRGDDLRAITPIAAKERHKVIHPSIALVTDLPGSARALVYRFQSAKLARAAAPSLLEAWGDGVQGCGRTVYFTRDQRRGSPAYSDWSNEVRSFLRAHCNADTMFGVIS